MKDRVPANPGRVLITPEDGSAPFYATMTRADNPTQHGDPLCKETLLKDATAALYGFSANAVPDEIFSIIAEYLFGGPDNYRWMAEKITREIIQSSESQSIVSVGERSSVTIKYAESYMLSDDGIIKLVNPTTTTFPGGSDNALAVETALTGKYFSVGSKTDIYFTEKVDDRYYEDSDGNVTSDYWRLYGYLLSVKTTKETKIVRSQDPNAYTDGETDADGFTYTALETVSSKAALFETGSYTGTGVYGAENKTGIPLNSKPKFVIVRKSDTGNQFVLIAMQGMDTAKINSAYNTTADLTLSWQEDGIYWFSTSAANQLNVSGSVYYYLVVF